MFFVLTGSAVATATTADQGDAMAKRMVGPEVDIMENEYIPITNIEVSPTRAMLSHGSPVQLTATVRPNDATCQDVVWSIPDGHSDYLQISETGLLAVGNNVDTFVGESIREAQTPEKAEMIPSPSYSVIVETEVVTTSADGRYTQRTPITIVYE